MAQLKLSKLGAPPDAATADLEPTFLEPILKTRKGEEVESTDVNFQVLRRTCATLFGAKAKDPRDTQAQLRHADPSITLRHHQKSIPASVQAAALALESDLMGKKDEST